MKNTRTKLLGRLTNDIFESGSIIEVSVSPNINMAYIILTPDTIARASVALVYHGSTAIWDSIIMSLDHHIALLRKYYPGFSVNVDDHTKQFLLCARNVISAIAVGQLPRFEISPELHADLINATGGGASINEISEALMFVLSDGYTKSKVSFEPKYVNDFRDKANRDIILELNIAGEIVLGETKGSNPTCRVFLPNNYTEWCLARFITQPSFDINALISSTSKKGGFDFILPGDLKAIFKVAENYGNLNILNAVRKEVQDYIKAKYDNDDAMTDLINIVHKHINYCNVTPSVYRYINNGDTKLTYYESCELQGLADAVKKNT